MSMVWVWIIIGSAATVALTLFVTWVRRVRVQKKRLLLAKRLLLTSGDSDVSVNVHQRHSDFEGMWERRWISYDDAVSRVVREAIKKGLLMFNPPTEMIQGHKERVEVGIARSTDLREELISRLHGRGDPQFEEIDTSLYMEAKLSGPAFEITSHSPPEQLIVPAPARWGFDVLPCRAGRQTLILIVNLRVEAKGVVGGRRAVSILERQIDIDVNMPFAARHFVTNNWQWLIPTVLTLAGTVAAWLVVPF